jgi:RNA polymerase sigma-70 factor, ECF subfamily
VSRLTQLGRRYLPRPPLRATMVDMSDSRDYLGMLVDAAREGDDVAVRELVRCTQPTVWRLCNLLGSPGEEEDLVQETYLRALRSLPTYRHESTVTAWLATIARRVCADHVRGRVRQRRLLDTLTGSVSDGYEPAPGNPTWELLAAIDPDRREAFVLTQLADMSYDEAAAVLDCPVGTIRSRVARARSDLADRVRAAEAS